MNYMEQQWLDSVDTELPTYSPIVCSCNFRCPHCGKVVVTDLHIALCIDRECGYQAELSVDESFEYTKKILRAERAFKFKQANCQE